KMKRRIQICQTMVQHGRQESDSTTAFWHDMLHALDDLDVAGMSDEEEAVDEAGNRVLMVHSPDWRHPKFERLFDQVDSTPSSMTTLFPPVGRPRINRVRSPETIQRAPPQRLPISYFRDTYYAV
ncbi:hypothetical protein FB446DRAFT_631059, partial [Lentinula raphanica]